MQPLTIMENILIAGEKDKTIRVILGQWFWIFFFCSGIHFLNEIWDKGIKIQVIFIFFFVSFFL